MRIIRKIAVIAVLLAAVLWCGSVIQDKSALKEELIRLHVVANSDSGEDQALKLQVRDMVTEKLSAAMEGITDAQQAKLWLQEHLGQLQDLVNDFLQEIGADDRAAVTLGEEWYNIREYDTFTLPSGVYDSLRITIGEGKGQNWWCVVFPSLCVPATSDGFSDVAAGAGFSQSLAGTLTGRSGYQARFFLLDCIGRLEKLFRR